MKLQTETAIVVCGIPASGKSTIAKILAKTFDVRHYDIDDDCRVPAFGQPIPNDGIDPVIDARDRDEMAGSYSILFGYVDGFLRARKSIIATCTLSSNRWGQQRLGAIYQQHPEARTKMIWCKPKLTDGELQERLNERTAKDYTGATSSVTRIRELEGRFESIVLPHLELDTAKPIGVCVEKTLDYIFYP
jgi:predicted kinase